MERLHLRRTSLGDFPADGRFPELDKKSLRYVYAVTNGRLARQSVEFANRVVF